MWKDKLSSFCKILHFSFLDFHQFTIPSHQSLVLNTKNIIGLNKNRKTANTKNTTTNQNGQKIMMEKTPTASSSLRKISDKLTQTPKPIVQTMIPMRYRYKIAVPIVIVYYFLFSECVFSCFNISIVYHIRMFMSIQQVLKYFI